MVDKGYHNGRQIQQCTDANITTIVAQQEIVNSNEKGTTPEYMVTKFVYNKTEDTYSCPQGEVLKTTGTWHEKIRWQTTLSLQTIYNSSLQALPGKAFMHRQS
ncbi:MAG: hypothetical protein IPH46_14020 [Bacteroidetes bacterium]|nr:hypothetical protein [Bacteroidota bacterium]